MTHLGYLIAAYTVVWIIIGFYLFTLIRRDRRLNKDLEELEGRIRELEQGNGPSPTS